MRFLLLAVPCHISFNVILLCLQENIRPFSFLSLICEANVPRRVTYHMQIIHIVSFMHLAEPLCVLFEFNGGRWYFLQAVTLGWMECVLSKCWQIRRVTMTRSGMWVPAIVTYRIISMPDFPTCSFEQGAGSDTANCDSNRTFVLLTSCVFHNSTSHILDEMIIQTVHIFVIMAVKYQELYLPVCFLSELYLKFILGYVTR